MAKITLSEVLEMLDLSRSKLYQDAKDGKITTETDEKDRKIVDAAELERVYGKIRLRNPADSPETPETDSHGHTNGHNPNSPEPSEVVRTLKEQGSTLKEQLEQVGQREKALIAEKTQLTEREDKLLDMLSTKQEKTRILMLQNPEQEEQKARGWFQRLIGA